MKRWGNVIFQTGVLALVLFTALVVVAISDFATPGDMSPDTALAIAAGCIAVGVALQVVFLRGMGGGHGHA